MSERTWTDAQRYAIGYRGKNLLVSAAAGSGKTATLTERIIRLITDPETGADVSRMLIVTFTKAAASELRERVTAAIGAASSADAENRHLAEQLIRVGDAQISTMDSFFLSCVKPMFAEVGLPADFRIGDTAEIESLREEAMADTVDFFFDSPDEDREQAISAIAETIGSARTEDGIDRVLLEFEAAADRVGIGEDELCAYAAKLESLAGHRLLTTDFGKCIMDEIIAMAHHYRRLGETLAGIMAETPELTKSYVPAALEMADYCARLASAAEESDLDGVEHLLENLPKMAIRSKVPTDESELFKTAKAELKKETERLLRGYFYETAQVTADVLRKTAFICRTAGEIIGEFRRRAAELKRRRGIADHSDIAKMAASLLANVEGEPTPYGESVASRFDYVFIDEYQDTSVYQDRIFSAVSSKCGRFMVGDIKQSIYRFRGGEPALFGHYRQVWNNGGEGETVFMSENFRCASPVVDFVNAVSRHMFPHGGIPFEEGDLLIHGRSEPDGYVPAPVEVCLVQKPAKKADAEDGAPLPSGNLVETEYVARRIRDLLDHGTLPDGSPILPRHIAVMLRGLSARRQEIAAVFARHGIPLNDAEDAPLLDRPEIVLLRCILTAIDDPAMDVELAGAMRSAAFGFTMGELAQIGKCYRDSGEKGSLWDAVRYSADAEDALPDGLARRCGEFCQRLGELRALSETLTAEALLYDLIHRPDVAAALEIEGGEGAADRAMEFYDLARGRSEGLYRFLEYVRHLQKVGVDARDNSAGGGVSLMTVHHSKGLEFPVCILMGADKAYNRSDERRPMLLHRDFGVAMKLPDGAGLVRCDNSLRRLAAFRTLRDNSEEEMRVLYVAMTRARERLIVTGVTADPLGNTAAAKVSSRFSDGYTVRRTNCYLDLIMEALALYGGDFAKIVPVPYAENDAMDAEEQSEGCDEAGFDPAQMDALEERLAFEYQYRHLQNIPSKLTVSRLYPEILDDYDDGSAFVENEEPREPSVPNFLRGTAYSPADAGSAAHLFLQFCDFARLEKYGVGAELCRLVDEGFMTSAEGEAAELGYLEAFRRSGFFKEILEAKEIHREFRFNAAIPAATLTADPEKAARLTEDGVNVTVQGVIDIVFVDSSGNLVLADYKTDRLTPRELGDHSAAAEKLWKRHGDQLRYYAVAVEKLFGRKPDKTVIYSMPLGDTVSGGL